MCALVLVRRVSEKLAKVVDLSTWTKWERPGDGEHEVAMLSCGSDVILSIVRIGRGRLLNEGAVWVEVSLKS